MLYPEDGHIREREDSAVMGEERHSGRKSGIGEGKRSKIGVNDKYNMKERRNFLLKKENMIVCYLATIANLVRLPSKILAR